MKTGKKPIYIAQHVPTGAKVPMLVTKMTKDNVIEEYKEFLEDRKGFTLSMLENRWDKCRDDVVELLQKFQVPAHVNHKDVTNLQMGMIPLDVAIFFEEYIYGIEKKTKMQHNKLKSKTVVNIREH